MRFNLRNARFGIKGDLSDYAGYRFQVDFCAEGAFTPLDFYGILKPAKNLSLQFGQMVIPFENSYIVTPGEMMFSNRVFISEYFTPGARDMGLMMGYKFLLNAFPFEAQAGMFNGGKMNVPEWTGCPSYTFRLIAGSMDGFRASAKIYRYPNKQRNQFFWAADLHYAQKSYRIEAEVMNQRTVTTKEDLFGGYLQGAWYYYLKREGFFHHLSPTFRWDSMGYDVLSSGFGTHRATLGINLGLSPKSIRSVLRFEYEHYLLKENAKELYFSGRDIYAAENKFIMEFLITF
jgi:hypothetical protein